MVPFDLRRKFSHDAYWIRQSSTFPSAFLSVYKPGEASIKRRMQVVSMLLISVSEQVELA